MKLSEWAKQNGLSYRTAHRLFQSGKLPCEAQQLATGTILVHPTEEPSSGDFVVLYGRVSSRDQKDNLERQMNRLRDYASEKGFRVTQEITEIGSGLNGSRKKLLKILSSKSISTIIVEHRDRLSRFGVDYIEAALDAAGKRIIVINEEEETSDLLKDFTDVVTSMCARIYGRRSAKNRAKRAIKAAESED